MAPSKNLLPPYHIHHEFLSRAELAGLLDWALDHEADFAPTRIKGEQIDPTVRRSLGTRRLGPMEKILSDRVRALVAHWVEALNVSTFIPGRLELELVAHTDNAHFRPHVDVHTGASRDEHSDRVLSAVYYFHREPKRFEGGALRLLPFIGDSDGIDIPPEQNSLVVFPSWARHEVRHVSCPSGDFADSRFAVNCWVRRSRIS